MTTGKTIEGKYVLSNIKAWDNAVVIKKSLEENKQNNENCIYTVKLERTYPLQPYIFF